VALIGGLIQSAYEPKAELRKRIDGSRVLLGARFAEGLASEVDETFGVLGPVRLVRWLRFYYIDELA
jgi:hypothetical protein